MFVDPFDALETSFSGVICFWWTDEAVESGNSLSDLVFEIISKSYNIDDVIVPQKFSNCLW